jgi:hypothetical protein
MGVSAALGSAGLLTTPQETPTGAGLTSSSRADGFPEHSRVSYNPLGAVSWPKDRERVMTLLGNPLTRSQASSPCVRTKT